MRKSSPKRMRVCPLVSLNPCIEIILHSAITFNKIIIISLVWSSAWSHLSWHDQAQSCKIKCYIRLRASGKYGHRPKLLDGYLKTSLFLLEKLQSQGCHLLIHMIFILPFSPMTNDLISDMRHQRGIVFFSKISCHLIVDSLLVLLASDVTCGPRNRFPISVME